MVFVYYAGITSPRKKKKVTVQMTGTTMMHVFSIILFVHGVYFILLECIISYDLSIHIGLGVQCYLQRNKSRLV